MKPLRKVMLIICVLLLAACSQSMKDFSCEGLTISLPSSYNFKQKDSQILLLLQSEVKGLSVNVVGAQEKHELKEYLDIETLEEFAQDLLYDYDFEEAGYVNDSYLMSAEVDVDNGRIFELHAFKDDGEHFWWLVFTSAAKDRSVYEEEFRQWAEKVRFE